MCERASAGKLLNYLTTDASKRERERRACLTDWRTHLVEHCTDGVEVAVQDDARLAVVLDLFQHGPVVETVVERVDRRQLTQRDAQVVRRRGAQQRL